MTDEKTEAKAAVIPEATAVPPVPAVVVLPVSKDEVVADVPLGISKYKEFDSSNWNPKTSLGKKVKAGEITDIDEILDKGLKILEPEIVDMLVPNLESDLFQVGQSKGKFGGGKRSIWRQTQKKTKEGNKPSFGALAVVGNRNGYVGIGAGKSKETVPAREKALRNAKLNLIKIRRGSGSWQDTSGTPNTIPIMQTGRCGSVRLKLIPAPRGTNLCLESECQKLLRLAGIKDIYSKSYGHTTTKLNMIKACFDALQKVAKAKLSDSYKKMTGTVDGRLV